MVSGSIPRAGDINLIPQNLSSSDSIPLQGDEPPAEAQRSQVMGVTNPRPGSSRRIPSSPSTPNLRSLNLSSSSSTTTTSDVNHRIENDDQNTPLASPRNGLFPALDTMDTTPTIKNRDKKGVIMNGSPTSYPTSRTLGNGTSFASSSEMMDEFGGRMPSSAELGAGSTARPSSSVSQETIRAPKLGNTTFINPNRQPSFSSASSSTPKGIKLELDTRALPSSSASYPTDRTGDPIPFSAPGMSAYPSNNISPSTPTDGRGFNTGYSFTPSPTRTRHDRPSSSSSSSSRQKPHDETHPNDQPNEPPRRPFRHFLQNHTSDFLPQDVAHKMQRWVQEVVVCNFDIDRGPVVERRMIGRPWGKGERANVAFSAFPDTSLFAEGNISYSFKIRQYTGLPLPLQTVPDAAEGGTSADEESYFAPGTTATMTSRSSVSSDDTSSLIDDGAETPMPPTRPAPQDPVDDESEDQFVPLPRTPLPSRQTKDGSFFGPKTELPETPMAQKVLPTPVQTAEDYRRWDERGREWLYGFVWFCQKKDRSLARGYMQRSIVILTHFPFPSLFLAVLDKVAPMYFDYGYPALEALCYGFASWPDPAPGAELQLPLLTDLLSVRLPDLTEEPQLPPPLADKSVPGAKSLVIASLPPIAPLKVFASLLPSLWHVWECMVLGEPLLVIAPDPQTCSTIVWWLGDIMKPIPTESADLRPYLHIHDLDFRVLVNSNKPQPGVVVGVTNPFFRNAAGHWPNVISVGGASPKPKVSTAPSNIVEHPQGFLSARKRHVSKDRVLLKKMEDLVAAGKQDDASGNAALRTFFIQMTEKMLSPLNRYVTSLIPPVGTPEGIKPFGLPAFLQHLKATAPNPLQFRSQGLTTKGKVEIQFYSAFCKSPGFAGWLRNRLVSLTEAKWGPGQSSRIPLPVLSLSAGYNLSSPSASPRRGEDFGQNRPSNDSSHRSSISSAAWSDRLYGRRGSEGVILSSSLSRKS